MASRHQHRHWHRHQHRRWKNFISSCKVFIFTFRSFLWRKHPWWNSFQIHLLTFLGVSGTILCSYSVENLPVPAFEERNSTVDFVSVVLKTRKAESCILQVYKILIRNPIRDHLQENSVIFKAPLRNLERISFLEVFKLYTLSLHSS